MSQMTRLRNLGKQWRLTSLRRRFQSDLSKPTPGIIRPRPTGTSPRPGEKLNTLFFVNKHNSLSQRVALELKKRQHKVTVHEITDPKKMTDLAFNAHAQVDLILCPYLTKRIPKEVCTNPDIPCWIVHPGIEGDRGMTSIDWALYDMEDEWGVSVLQAALEMDRGDIWSSINFPVKREDINTLTKSSLYLNEVTQTAVKAVLEAVDRFQQGEAPRPLDYSSPYVRGVGRPNMTKCDRTITWEMSADEVACQIRMSDSAPGAVAYFRINDGTDDWKWTKEFRVFGAHLEKGKLKHLQGKPGEILGQRHGAVLVKCGRGAVWVSHLKKDQLKLPATMWLQTNTPTLPDSMLPIPYGSHPITGQDIWSTMTPDGVCFVHFEFYNGAMSTTQCRRLERVLQELEDDAFCKVIVLMGGRDMFSNGIHLNVIEGAADQVGESWNNINAINDVVRSIFTSKKVTISALRGNAGAGGVMMALASDFAFAREGVVLNPHYKQMKLFGSEYHTYFLPKRVGNDKGQQLLNNAEAVLASEAVDFGLLDGCMGGSAEEFERIVLEHALYLARPTVQKHFTREKNHKASKEVMEKIEKCRSNELDMMSKNFQDPAYHQARKNFVYH